MIKLENGGLRAPLKISLGSGLHSQKGIRAPVSKNDRAPGSTTEISGLQGSRDPPFGTLKNVVFPAQAENSYFVDDFRLEIFLYYS